MPQLGSAVRIAGATLLAFSLAACETARFAPPSDAARAAMSEATVEASQVVAPTDPESPIANSDDAAAEGAGQGALGSLVLGFTGCMPVAPVSPIVCAGTLALGIVAAPFAAIGGAIVGSSRAHGEAEVAAASAAIRRALADSDLGDSLGTAFASVLQAQGGPRLVPAISDAASPAEAVSAAGASVDQPARLELRVTGIAFGQEGSIEPELTLLVTVRGVLFDPDTPAARYWRVWVYRGLGEDYFDLAADDAALLKRALDRAAVKLAERIHHDLFIATEPERKLASLGEEDTVWTLDAPLLESDAAPVRRSSGTSRNAVPSNAGSAEVMPPSFYTWKDFP